MSQTLIIAGVDFSGYIQQEVGVQETPIYSNGSAEGETLAAGMQRDRLGIRFANTFALKPLPQSLFYALLQASAANTVSVTLTTARFSGSKTIDAQVSVSSYSYATTALGERIYTGATITIEGNDAEL